MVLEALREMFSTQSFMPHGHCYMWQPGLVWLQVTTNLLIGLAYVSIAGTLAYLVRKVEDIPFKWVYVCFGIFIITCGFTHFFHIYVIYSPAYWADGLMRLVTAVASVATAVLLFPLVPKALAVARGAKEAHVRGVELESLVRDLGQMYEKSKELDELKSQFFANVSHELRTPLSLIITPTEKLLRARNLDEEQKRDAEVILRNAHTVLRHVNDLLDVATTEAGEMRPNYEQADVARLVRRMGSHFEVLTEERGLSFEVQGPEELLVETDVEKVERIVLNLLSNAFKFTPDGGEVRCSVRLGQGEAPLEQESMVRRRGKTERRDRPLRAVVIVEVADSGPGIAPEKRQVVFERFQQLEGGKTRRFGGTGLGLVIVKEFVELLGGVVEVADASEGGALFRIELPMEAPAYAEVTGRERDEHQSSERTRFVVEEMRHSKRAGVEEGAAAAGKAEPGVSLSASSSAKQALVLVVEDNAEMNRYVCEVLEKDYRVESAHNGKEGFHRALELRPDLIVSDVMMPQMSGDEMVAALREREEVKDIPVMMLTAKADDELRVTLLKGGAMDYLMKPFSGEELRARAENLVAIKRTGDVLRKELRSKSNDIEELAQMLAQRTRELEGALQTAQRATASAREASEVKKRFMRMVSHELRTPLTSLQLYTDLVRAEDERLSEQQIESLERMEGRIRHLADLVESVLNQVTIESGELQVAQDDRIKLEALVASVLEDHAQEARRKGLGLNMEPPKESLECVSDERLLRLAVGNLVGNAVKFTEKGEVKVEVGYDESRREYGITVRDTGPGIDAEIQERIFQPFEHLEEIERKHTPGFGLGLALTREVVQALGGRIEVASQKGKGSTFTIVLPNIE